MIHLITNTFMYIDRPNTGFFYFAQKKCFKIEYHPMTKRLSDYKEVLLTKSALRERSSVGQVRTTRQRCSTGIFFVTSLEQRLYAYHGLKIFQYIIINCTLSL